jgi:hypothetical protein
LWWLVGLDACAREHGVEDNSEFPVAVCREMNGRLKERRSLSLVPVGPGYGGPCRRAVRVRGRWLDSVVDGADKADV